MADNKSLNLDVTAANDLDKVFDRFTAQTRWNLSLDPQFDFPYATGTGNPSLSQISSNPQYSSSDQYDPPERAGTDGSASSSYPQNFPILNSDAGLSPISSSHKLHPSAAASYAQMRVQAAKEGVKWTVCSSFRTLDHQIRLFEQHGGRFDKATMTVIKPSDGFVAVPGKSPHQRAIAIDLSELTTRAAGSPQAAFSSSLYAWLFENGWKWGWINPSKLRDGRGVDEAWHWEWHPSEIGKPQGKRFR